MNALRRTLPGGLFPRFVAVFPLFFPLTLVHGVLLGFPVTLPEVVLVGLGFYFLFEHESFREREWTLWPVLFFLASSLALSLMNQGAAFDTIKSWIFFPLIYFVMARNVFREKASMILLAQKAWLWISFALSVLVVLRFFRGEALASDGASLFLAPAVVLGFVQSASSRTRSALALGLSTALVGLFALLLLRDPSAFLCISFSFGVYGLLQSRLRHSFWFWPFLSVFIFALGLGLFFMGGGSDPFFQGLDGGPNGVALTVLLLSLVGLLARALPWMQEQDAQRRFAVATALLCFVPLALLNISSVTVSHAFLFWFFMAILL